MAQRRIAVYSDTPELQALSKGYARQAHQAQFARGYGEARAFGNKLVMRATAVPEGEKAQIAFLAGRYGAYGDEGGQFLQPLTGVKLQAELGLTSPHFLNKAFEANIRPSPSGFQQSNINGLDVLRAYKHPKPSAILSPPVGRSTTYGTISSAPISTINPPVAVKVASTAAATALAVHQTRSAAHRERMNQRAQASATRLATSPTYLVKTAAPYYSIAELDAYLHKILE